jgi:twitching motility protein PilT
MYEADVLLNAILDSHPSASDINITVGKPFQVEVDGRLFAASLPALLPTLTPFHTETFALQLLKNDRRAIGHLLEHGSTDISYSLGNRARFRVNIFSGRGTSSIVMRRLPTRIPSISDLHLPSSLRDIAQEQNGLVLLTGATGTGKSSTLAALLRQINETREVHVVTLEDPVEFLHPQQKATFNQRELGADFDTFANGLRAALRQAPKVILVGEMRDRESLEIALHAGETGHLVLSTLHTVDAGQTINRIIGMFEHSEEQLTRIRLASLLRWCVSQRLLPKVGGGRIAVAEILYTNLRVQEAIMHGETEGKTFYEIIDAGVALGMQTFDRAILQAFENGLITEQTAMAYASQRSIVRRGIDNVKSARGERTSDVEGLALDEDYERRVLDVSRRS